MAATSPVVAQLCAALDQAFGKRSWHGTNLRGSIRGLSIEAVVWRPAPGRHNIWELVVHCAYWKYVVWRQITGAPRGSFPLSGSDWFERPTESTVRAWRADIRLLEAMHGELRAAVQALPERALGRRAKGAFTAADVIAGAAAHDLYHAGQIQLIKRLQRD
jgi:hypothetical protein